MDGGHGILAIASYLPRHRLVRQAAVDANRWFAPSLVAHRHGTRSFGNWDEDAVTMAVEAGRTCLGTGTHELARLKLASTTLPFRDRTHAGIVADALGLGHDVATQDLAGGRRAGTSALLEVLEDRAPSTLVVASECLDPRPASALELTTGHGACAVLIGEGDPVVRLVGGATHHADLVDRYRADDDAGDYVLEERWVRDEGLHGFLLDALEDALTVAGVSAAALKHLVLPLPERAAAGVARRLGAADAARPRLDDAVGQLGTAQPLAGLQSSLRAALPGDLILVAGFGHGADALVLEVLPAWAKATGRAARPLPVTEERCYPRYLALRGRLDIERGIRFERDNRTAQSVQFRKRSTLAGFVAGRCDACDAVQFPPARYCVACREQAGMSPVRLAEQTGRVRSFTEDWLAATPRPPLIFGSVDFPGGASVVMEFTDFEPGTVAVGDPVRMAFRIKDLDERRGYRRYFWKPTPPPPEAADG